MGEQVEAADGDVSRTGQGQAAQDAEQAGFAAAIGAGQDDELTLPHRQGQIGDGGAGRNLAGAGIDMGQVVDGDHRALYVVDGALFHRRGIEVKADNIKIIQG